MRYRSLLIHLGTLRPPPAPEFVRLYNNRSVLVEHPRVLQHELDRLVDLASGAIRPVPHFPLDRRQISSVFLRDTAPSTLPMHLIHSHVEVVRYVLFDRVDCIDQIGQRI
jgi:hypothetical protein